MASHDPTTRRLIAQLAGLSSVAGRSVEERNTQLADAREKWRKTFELQVDPDGVLDPAERAERAAYARRAHMKRLALKGAAARTRNNTARRQALAEAIEAIELDHIAAAEDVA